MKLVSMAGRNLSRNRRRTAISLTALVIAVTAMIGFRGFIGGVQRMMIENFIEGQVGAIQVHRAGYLKNVLSSPLTLDLADTPELRARIAAVPGVVAVAPRISFGAMFSLPDALPVDADTPGEAGKVGFLFATAIEPEHERKVTPQRFGWLGEGRYFTDAEGQALVLNADLARGLGVSATPDAAAWAPEELRPALLAADRDGSLNGEPMVVSGLLRSVMPGDKKVALLPLATAQKLLRMEGRVTEYAIAVADTANAGPVRDRLAAALGPEYEVDSWEEVMPFLRELRGSEDLLFDIMSGVFFAIVLLGIVNVMLMNVLERVREIGTMLAVGTRRRQIVALFVLEGIFLGTVGGLLGAAAGSLIVFVLNQRGIHLTAPGTTVEQNIRPIVDAVFVLRTVALTGLGAGLAALWPAYRASRLRPVEALQST